MAAVRKEKGKEKGKGKGVIMHPYFTRFWLFCIRFLRDFGYFASVFYAILVILHQFFRRDARSASSSVPFARKSRFFAKNRDFSRFSRFFVDFSRFSRFSGERHTTARASRIAPKNLMQNNSNRVKN